MTNALEASGITVTRRDGTRLVDVTELTVPAGRCVAIVGESGAGKTLLAHSVIGCVDPFLRTVLTRQRIAETEVTNRNRARVVAEHIGYVNQDAFAALDPLQPIARQVGEALRLRRVPAASHRGRIRDALTAAGLNVTPRLEAAFPHELSGGMRQRALIAAATVTDPPLVIADEPTTALDATVQTRVLATLRDYVNRGTGLLLITHDLQAVRQIADTVLVMAGGTVVEQGPVARVLSSPAHPVTRALVEADRAGRGARSHPLRGGDEPAVVSAEGLSLGHRGNTAVVRRVSFSVRAGETLGIVGESGSGKTTLVMALLGVLRPLEGTLTLPERGVQWVPQNVKASFTPGVTVGGVLREAIVARERAQRSTRARDTASAAAGEAQRSTPGRLSRRAIAAEVAERAAAVGLPRLSQRVERLSGGQAQRLAIARAIAARPKVLVCDEPVSGLDASVRARIVTLLREQQQAHGFAMVYVSHELSSVAQLATRVLVLREGETVEQGLFAEVARAPRHPFTSELFRSLGNPLECGDSDSDDPAITGELSEEQSPAAAQ